jgi:hypothetical protein
MRLRKIEYASLVVAVLSVVWFGNWFQNEMDRVARARSLRSNCPGTITADLLRVGSRTIQCGVVSREAGSHLEMPWAKLGKEGRAISASPTRR